MQSTRQRILRLLKERGQATVEDLADDLGLTSVTIRHHLDILRSDGLVDDPVVLRRSSRGRPQFTYRLTGKADDYFPTGFCDLAGKIIAVMKENLGEAEVGEIFASVARRVAAEAPRPAPGDPLTLRLDRAVEFLNDRGYVAHWDQCAEGYLLSTCNCPFHGVSSAHQELCGLDSALVASMVGAAPVRTGRVIEGAPACSYLIRAADLATA